ncbi:MAG: trypsin-like serine protease [Planctomycetota bacterium]
MTHPRAQRLIALALGAAPVAFSFAPDAQGIVRRDDVADQVYIDAALAPEYDAVGRIFTNAGQCTATLITPDTILTAAHCFGAAGSNATASTFEIQTAEGLQVVDVSNSTVLRHPGWTGSFETGVDIAIIQLDTPITSVEPALLDFGIRSNSLTQDVTAVGYGRAGTGSTGSQPGTEGTKRAGENRIDVLTTLTGGTRSYLQADFDTPGAGPFNQALDTEFSAASGDSGGPIFLTNVFDQERIVGVSSFISAADGVADGDYGDTSGWTPVADGYDWLFPLIAGEADGVFFGDANFSGSVELIDFDILSSNFDSVGATWSTGDFNGDGVVNLVDFDLLSQNFGNSFFPVGVLATPEPGTLAGLALAGGLLARRRRLA